MHYFVHIDGFRDGTGYMYFKGGEDFRRGIIVRTDGSETSCKVRLWQAMARVRRKVWKEITEQEAKQLLKTEAPC